MNANAITGEPLTTTLARQNSDELLRNEVDQRITLMRPMATPVDQISRFATSRPAKSMTVDYYAVASRENEARTSATVEEQIIANAENETLDIPLANPRMFDPSETILFPTIINDADEPLLFYVVAINDTSIKVRPVNGASDPDAEILVPGIPAGTKLIRMGRAAAELDVQTSQYEALPRKQQQFCQIFKCQIEQSTLMRAANKEVGWTLSDQEEVAIYDMRLGMERTFLFGRKGRITDPEKRSEIFLTDGIWHQAGKEAYYPKGNLTSAAWLKVMSAAFTGHAGSARKILIAGTQLIEQLSLLDGGQQRVMLPGDVVTRWGLDFTEMHSKFGTLYVIHSEVLDSCGHAADGLIIDPEYLTKYVHVPFSATTLDLRTSGQRNTEAVVLTEVSCLVLRYPEAHVRIIGE